MPGAAQGGWHALQPSLPCAAGGPWECSSGRLGSTGPSATSPSWQHAHLRPFFVVIPKGDRQGVTHRLRRGGVTGPFYSCVSHLWRRCGRANSCPSGGGGSGGRVCAIQVPPAHSAVAISRMGVLVSPRPWRRRASPPFPKAPLRDKWAPRAPTSAPLRVDTRACGMSPLVAARPIPRSGAQRLRVMRSWP